MPALNTPPPDDDATIVMWGQVIRGFQTTNRLIHAALKERFNLNEAEAETLLSLHRSPDNRARHNLLAQGTGVTTGGFTKVAEKLTQRGLTARVACAEDRRVIYLALTDAGLELATELSNDTAKAVRESFIDALGRERAELVSDAMLALYRANLAPASK